MTVETPLHVQARDAPHERHAIDAAVTCDAPDPLVDVDAVVEVDVVGEVVHARPLERPVRPPARAHRLERRAVGPDLGVARHAGLRRRDARHRRGLDRGVAVAAVDPDSADVVLVAELDRLLARDEGLGDVVGAVEGGSDESERRHDEDGPEDAHPRDGVGAAVEYLSHSSAVGATARPRPGGRAASGVRVYSRRHTVSKSPGRLELQLQGKRPGRSLFLQRPRVLRLVRRAPDGRHCGPPR